MPGCDPARQLFPSDLDQLITDEGDTDIDIVQIPERFLDRLDTLDLAGGVGAEHVLEKLQRVAQAFGGDAQVVQFGAGERIGNDRFVRVVLADADADDPPRVDVERRIGIELVDRPGLAHSTLPPARSVGKRRRVSSGSFCARMCSRKRSISMQAVARSCSMRVMSRSIPGRSLGGASSRARVR